MMNGHVLKPVAAACFASACSAFAADLPAQPPVSKWEKDIAAFVKGQPHLRHVETYDMVLAPDGQPRPELFIKDRLRFNAEGYKLLAERVRADVERAYPGK